MPFKRLCEHMCAVQVLAGAEVKVAPAVVRIQNGLKILFIRHANRAGRKARILIGIVRGVKFQMAEKYPFELVILAESHRRLGLQEHAAGNTVEINAGYLVQFGLVV